VANLLWPAYEEETVGASPVVAQTATVERSPARWLIPLLLLCLIPLGWLLTRQRRPVAYVPAAPVPAAPRGSANRAAPDIRQIPTRTLPQSVDLYFDTGSSRLRPESAAKLREFTAALQGTEGRDVMVKGYTDNVGSAASNMRLSEHRADAVKADLMRTGIGSDRISAQGLGEENFIADNSTADGRAKNRRVTVEVGAR
jgi:OOP family OmpA-OmpF porin